MRSLEYGKAPETEALDGFFVALETVGQFF